mmetsp:Transcript_19770/g.34004  ORF Transcript_19770/g.34004 Transcript_19770/m.34004 type:complete len:147 (-) Transcript_19770:569-1009(-)
MQTATIPEPDIEVVALSGGGPPIKCNRNYLATKNKVFRDILAKTRGSTVVVEDVSYDSLKLIIQYIYDGKLPEEKRPGDLEALLETLIAVDKFGVVELRDTWEKELTEISEAAKQQHIRSSSSTWMSKCCSCESSRGRCCKKGKSF